MYIVCTENIHILTIPMLDVVKTAFEMEREQQLDMLGGLNEQVIDGMTGFVFQNREGRVPNPQTVNQGIFFSNL